MKKLPVLLALVALVAVGMAGAVLPGPAEAQESDTKNDPSVTPWSDPDDPHVIRLNKDDPSAEVWNYRNPRLAKDRKGPTDLQRYGSGMRHEAFPTFLSAPVALTPQELKDGDIDVAIVGSLTDMNPVPGTRLGANYLRAINISSADYFVAKGDGKQETLEDVFPFNTYLRNSLGEINLADYGNIKAHPYSGEKSTEEVRAVLGEIYEGGALPMLVGGSHDNMVGLFLAVADEYGKGNFGVIHFDSHADTIMDGYGFYVHNANGIAMGEHLGLYKGEDIVQVGLTSVGPDDSLLVVALRDGPLVGIISWRSTWAFGPQGCVEIGILLLPDHRGHGHGTAAQRMLVDYLFSTTTVHRIQATTEVDNVAEQRALERAGFIREGVLRGGSFVRGQWRDYVLYGRLRTDPPPLARQSCRYRPG